MTYPATYGPVYGSNAVGNFPQQILDAKVEAKLPGWTDLSAYAYQRQMPALTRGRGSETAQVSAPAWTGELNNRDGRFTPGNPAGAYYPNLGRNTAFRSSVPAGYSYLRMDDDTTSWIACPDSVSLRITGPIDIRLDMRLNGHAPCVLASKWGSTATSWVLALNGDGTLTFGWYTGSVTSTAVTTGSDGIVPLGRIAVRVTLDTASGTTAFYTALAMSGPWTLVQAIPGSGPVTLSGGTGQVVRVGDSPTWDAATGTTQGPTGQFFEFQLRNGIGGTLVASPVFTSQAAAATGSSFTDAEGNTWTTFGTAEISDRSYRGHFEMSSLPVTWDSSGRDVFVPAQFGGILRRLNNQNPDLPSPIRRAILGLAGVVAYWPMEDSAAATTIAPLIGPYPATISGSPALAADSSFICSSPLPQIGSGIIRGLLPRVDDTGTIVVRFLLNPDAAVTNYTDVILIATTGTYNWSVAFQEGSGIQLAGSGIGGPLTPFITTAGGTPVLVSVELTTSGGNVSGSLRMMTIDGTVTSKAIAPASFAATTGRVTTVTGNPDGGGTTLHNTVIGHVFVQDTVTPLADLAGPLAAWVKETAGNRFRRLCEENSIASRIYGYPSTTAAMGPQQITTLQTLLQQIEDADRGMIYDPRQVLGLGYRTLASMLNQPAQVTFFYTSAHIGDGTNVLAPSHDDSYVRNDVTVTRAATTGGASFAVATLADGSAMSTGTPPAGVGDYQYALTVYCAADGQLAGIAGWVLHVGTCPEQRYPLIPLNLARSELASLMQAIQDLELGDRIDIVAMPSWQPLATIRQIIAGTSETEGGYLYQISWNALPESPYETGIVGDATYGHEDTDGSTVHTAINATTTTMLVDTTNAASPLWTTAAGDFPFDITVTPRAGLTGEQMTVTNISGSSSPQTFTVVRSVNGVVIAHGSGEDVRLAYAPVMAIA
jgi:hypothetical protein